jgi:predicted acyl esterase
MPADATFDVIHRDGTHPSEGGHPGFGHRVEHAPGMIIERDVAVALRDGVTIYVDVLPPRGRRAGAGAPRVGALWEALPRLLDLRPLP